MLTSRWATSDDDIALADDLMARAWLSGSPTCVGTPAGIEWWHAGSWPDPIGEHLRLWSDDGVPVGWSWHDEGELEWHVWTGDPARDVAVLRAIVETALEEAGPARPVAAWAAEDDEPAIAVFDALGLAPTERRLSQWQRRVTDGAPPLVALPEDYRIRALAGPADIPARVDVHRAAFEPSKLSVEKYERLVTMPHYRYEDDLVVIAPDDTFAAFAMAWWDPVARVGEFEPVGTHPAHQRRGLALALLTFGIHRFFDMGAAVVQVYSDATSVGPEALYPAAGFARRAIHRRFERPAAIAADPGL